MVAWVIASVLTGLVGDRWSPRYVLVIAGAAATLGPLYALAAHLAGGGWLAKAYPVVFVTLGIFSSAIWMGFLNTMLLTVPAHLRPTYVGLGNTLVGLLTLAPVLGGWLLEATSYPVLFATTAVLTGAGLVMALRIRTPGGQAADAHSAQPQQPTVDS